MDVDISLDGRLSLPWACQTVRVRAAVVAQVQSRGLEGKSAQEPQELCTVPGGRREQVTHTSQLSPQLTSTVALLCYAVLYCTVGCMRFIAHGFTVCYLQPCGRRPARQWLAPRVLDLLREVGALLLCCPVLYCIALYCTVSGWHSPGVLDLLPEVGVLVLCCAAPCCTVM